MSSDHKYEVIKKNIIDSINRKDLNPGDKLPSEDEYSEQFSVSRITVRKAMTELAIDGYIKRIKGQGSFVCAKKTANDIPNSKLVAFVISAVDYRDVSYLQIIRGAQRHLSKYGYSLIIEWAEKDNISEKAAIEKMLEQNVDGFLIYTFDPAKSKSNYEMLTKKNIPYVLVDRHDDSYPSFYAGCSNYDGGGLATQELIRLGHTHICFIGYDFFLSSEKERYDGYCSIMRQAGLSVSEKNLIKDIDYNLLASNIRARNITALVCCNDKLAYKIINNLVEAGIQVPEDVSIFGFDDWQYSNNSGIRLSTIKQDFEAVGVASGNLLISAINGDFDGNSVKILVKVELIVRDSICEKK